MPERIYLDYAATTPVDPAVAKAMEPYLSDSFGNASSVHSFGQQAMKAVDEARVMIARFLNCQPTEIIFTSGATEANNMAIKGVVFAWLIDPRQWTIARRGGNNNHRPSSIVHRPHLVTTAIEHPSVLESCQALEQMGLAEVTYVKPQANGIVRVEDVIGAIKENTILVSVMSVNNEVGTIQPIREIGRALSSFLVAGSLVTGKNQRSSHQTTRKPIFHTDATQAIQFFNCRVDKLRVDLLSMSAHKIYGPKGVGAVYVRKGTPIRRFLDGGAQEFDLRAGTLNTPGVVGFGVAIERLEKLIKLEKLGDALTSLRDRFITGVLKSIPNTSLNGDPIHRLPNNVNIRFNGIDAQTLVMALDQAGIAASAGSACASGAATASPVITTMLGGKAAQESVRFSLGKWTTESEISYAIQVLLRIVKQVRSEKYK